MKSALTSLGSRHHPDGPRRRLTSANELATERDRRRAAAFSVEYETRLAQSFYRVCFNAIHLDLRDSKVAGLRPAAPRLRLLMISQRLVEERMAHAETNSPLMT
jgi:hypothetical protein